MKIIGVLSWYRESPTWLSACVASMAKLCDHIVAVDGRYSLFPDESPVSSPEEAEAIVETAAGAGIALTLHRPTEPFYGNEVEKRNLTLKLAAAVGEPGVDWLLILDADCVITEHSPLIREDLERCEELCANVAVEEHMDPGDFDRPMAVAKLESIPESWRTSVTLLHRLIPDMAYHGTHYTLGGTWMGEPVWLWGHPAALQPFDATHGIVVRHRNIARSRRRREQAAAYYAQRDHLGIEARPTR